MSCFSGRSHAVVALLTCGAAVGYAQAQDASTEKLKLRAGVTQAQDNNFQRAIDSKAVADQINTQTLDVIVALPYGQQRLELEANLATNKHQTFTQFFFSGNNTALAVSIFTCLKALKLNGNAFTLSADSFWLHDFLLN